MSIDTKMAMAEKALAAVIDCLEGVMSEQGYEGLERYAHDPGRMLAEAKSAREYIHDYAYGCEMPHEREGRVFIEETGKGKSCAAYRVVCEGRFARHETAHEALLKRGWREDQIRISDTLKHFV